MHDTEVECQLGVLLIDSETQAQPLCYRGSLDIFHSGRFFLCLCYFQENLLQK
jgi:hypothetical protein